VVLGARACVRGRAVKERGAGCPCIVSERFEKKMHPNSLTSPFRPSHTHSLPHLPPNLQHLLSITMKFSAFAIFAAAAIGAAAASSEV
jgi:hypothetical protein